MKKSFSKACKGGFTDIVKLLVEYLKKKDDVEAGTSGDATLEECLFRDNFYAQKAMKDKTELGEYLTSLKLRGKNKKNIYCRLKFYTI